ncbi:hypothetical protein N7449_010430 [Penicillium cf. viridicatum]|uniref:Uncharacterized protein n=1 Tax=Penicillium cf. viridicatum TaxID=2972119 RepID=A0A9W9M2Q1_9EURO|nr:hypothetical protein N7449_010430 [Penicillium cf. viridicatum]
MLDNDLGTREVPDVSTPKSHLCPSPFNVTAELFTVFVQRSVLNEILALSRAYSRPRTRMLW